MKLNLGCGEYPAAGWVNVDGWDGSKADVFASLDALPFAGGSASRVYAGHVLEHVHPDQLGGVLAEIRRVLADDGQFCAVGPDCDRIDPIATPELYAMAAAGRDGIGVNPRADHLWTCTEVLMLAHIRSVFPAARPVLIADVPEPWPVVSRIGWQCAVLA